MLTWIAHMVMIGLVAFVSYSISYAVGNKRIAQMIGIVGLIIALQTTIQDITPFVKGIQEKVDKITNLF